MQPDLIRDLGRLRVLAARAMDAVQVGEPVPDEFVEVAERVLAQVRSSACCGIQSGITAGQRG
jgi:hypothetical protein